ncbi:LLM class F420-dependent oxidoreductase [Thermomicrobium sp. CFH 73360]|uniref:LLM class F420-dependent oxidoreductase n=1 Tax=Thermomicrobium sp. CFH 73360 TaxID=2951987 RepID=UPI0020767951|nr:LLM class F420-dependent oxidoreductase [Thermomicrobium sp. CFH 73360]MCM8745322.1 LLM class F420-dependent oxidoreductase [Thermomicrobium sp. CFH 73360]
MRIGLVFPQTEIGSDPSVIREYAQAAEELGYTHILTYEHVVGVDLAQYPGWRGPYHVGHQFHEPFVLFGYLAAVTQWLELVTGVVILPQRQTVLVAKQAAEVDVLSGGRLRLGVGVGWNEAEYIALGMDFHTRGRREEEQIEVLRLLWTQPIVRYEGRWHHLPAVGLNPLPVQRPIPIWLGGMSEAARRRAARLADGWMPQWRPTPELRAMVDELREWVRANGRDPAAFGIEGRLTLAQVPRGEWLQDVEAWRELGATHLCINTMGLGLPSPRAHIALIQELASMLGLSGTPRSG